jgi:hypothetical protein
LNEFDDPTGFRGSNIMEEKSKLSDDFLSEYLMGFGSTRGCALLGKTSFDKMEAVQNFLSEQGRRFVVVDCLNEAGDADSLTKVAKRYQNTPYVIFNHCESILGRDDIIKVFAHLLDADEYPILFPTESFYVFIGDKNTLGQGANGENPDHIDSFCTFVNCYDFDKDERYMGHNATLVEGV